MKALKIIFLGTPEFARHHLAALVGSKDFKVVGVVTQPDRPAGRKMQLQKSPVKILAEEKLIPVISPESMKTAEAIEAVKGFGAEAAVVVAYGQILNQDFLDLFPRKVVNVHGSLLPRWRGAAPIQRALMAGDKESGVSLQVMVLKLDAGEIIAEAKLPLPNSMNATELHDALKEMGAKLLLQELAAFVAAGTTPRRQDEALVTYAHKISKENVLIDWALSSQEIHNHIRGLSMGPFAVTQFKGKPVKLHKSQSIDGAGRPGEVIMAEGDDLVVACGQGALRVLEIQPESRAKMDIRSFLAGHPITKGDCFG